MMPGRPELSRRANAAEFAPQAGNERGVKVTVTPRISSAAEAWDFQVVMETHTRDLGDDLAKAARLVADGKRYPPLGWEGAPPGGHHRKGLLRFKAISPKPQAVELQIRLSGDTAPRKFKWLLKWPAGGCGKDHWIYFLHGPLLPVSCAALL